MTEQQHFFGQDRLVEKFNEQPFALVFSGQGFNWLDTLRVAVAAGAGFNMNSIVERSATLTEPVADALAAARPQGFDPVDWASNDIDPSFDITQAALSVPGIFVSQLATLDTLEAQRLSLEKAAAVIGHSQGMLGVHVLKDLTQAAELLALAELIGAAGVRVARTTGLLRIGEQSPMLAIRGISRKQLQAAVDKVCADVPEDIRPIVGIRNAREAFVLVGRPEDNSRVRRYLEAAAAKDAEAIKNKERGGKPFSPEFTDLKVQIGFHHPAMQPAVEQVVEWAELCNLPGELAREVAAQVLVNSVDWVSEVHTAIDAGAKWLLDVGPEGGVVPLTNDIAQGHGVISLEVSSNEGQAAVFDPGHAPRLPRPWTDFAPRLVREGNNTKVETAFTRLTGRSPMLLAGMTPTTVDPEIVAAAANAGHWAELAGGGQVTPEILEENLDKLNNLLQPGVNAQFNSMFLDPYLWKMQIGGKRLVQRARANGAPIDGIVITAGMPEHDEAIALVKELRDNGFPWVCFKPGAVKHIKKILDIAREIPDIPIIMQVEGGKAGGHHSWEDLDDLLIATYDAIRQQQNVVLVVGGGIGTPERAADYISGDWAKAYDLPSMPVDGILVGTAAMATKEAKTSDSVKNLLVETKGSESWVGAGSADNGMASGRSQLGADIHEIDNSAARAGRLLDEVAGDTAAVMARREEIIEAIGKTCKPYFGDVEQLTYQQWLERYLELSGPDTSTDQQWEDVSWYQRFVQMLERAEARLTDQDHGTFVSHVLLGQYQAPQEGVRRLLSLYPRAATDKVHPADVAWFMGLARTPGKPVNFVPIIDKDVRRWWRSDSLWQANDDRYDADQVCIIPGPAAVAGITKANEPVAELLERFNDESVNRLTKAGIESETEDLTPVQQLLTAEGTYWAGRNIPSLIGRLGKSEAWELSKDATSATHPPTGARLQKEDSNHVLFTVPLAGSTAFGTTTDLEIRFTVPSGIAVPRVTQADAETAMAELTRVAAGGELTELVSGVATWTTSIDAAHLADYNNVTAGFLPASITVTETAPDVLVGQAWPAVFSAVRHAIIPGTSSDSVVEGMLSLVHLEHHVHLEKPLRELFTDAAADPIELRITAKTDEVTDTDMGRIVLVRATIETVTGEHGETVATLSERFAIRGRTGKTTARTNTSVLPSVIDTPRSFRAAASVTAPEDMRGFAVVTGDRNPIHVSESAAALAGLPRIIVHGMWTSAIGELLASSASESGGSHTIMEYTATMLAPVLPGEDIDFVVERVGVDNRPGYGEVREVTATVSGNVVLKATAIMKAPVTFYAFPGQGIQSQGMGMQARSVSKAAKAIWDRADQHTRNKLGFSILEVVQNNPVEVVVQGERFYHPDGVLYLTQFTQVGMATLGVAQIAEMREAGVLNQRAFFAGHSVGEYNALAAYAGVLSLESVLEIVYQRGLTMHRLVDRDAEGNSNYGLAALRPNKMGLTADNVFDFVAAISEKSGEFLEIVNYNLAGLQYAVAGTRAGLAALREAAEELAPGDRAFIMIPGIDVPFHSSKLRNGVADFRAHLDSLLPSTVDLDVLVGRYLPNLVARPFELTKSFVESMTEVVSSPLLDEILGDFDAAVKDEQKLARTLLIELLAWQFASPVRWIETQELALRTLGVERFVEVGVGSSPTIANMMGQTLRLPQYSDVHIEVLNVERERDIVFATDEVAREMEASVSEIPTADVPTSTPAETAPTISEPVAVSAATGPRPEDIPFTPADATEMLIAVWTKVRPDQITATDSIETLVDGVSARRNQLLLDLGMEFGLGAIDGAADAEIDDLKATVSRMAKGYVAFGPVLADASADALRRIVGPTGKRPSYIAERITSIWQLGQGWADHVAAAVVVGAREGASLRGGDLATLRPAAPTTAPELDTLIDAAVAQVATQHGVSVALPSSGGGTGGVVDSAALGEFAEQVTGRDGVLAATAQTILTHLGLGDARVTNLEESDDSRLLTLVSQELGSDWPRLVAPSFDANKTVLLDDRWASAREDLARIALGVQDPDEVNLTGAGEIVAKQAEYWGFADFAAQARNTEQLDYAEDVAVVTGASPNSIAAAVTGQLLEGGATVVVTTSSLDHDRLSFYKELYRSHARGQARLWIVPANLNSFADLDALVDWVANEQTATVNGAKKLLKPALVPTLLFPFAAPRVLGSLADAGPRAETEMRLLLWSVERLIAGLSAIGVNTEVGRRLHVVLPGSPNRGRFGGDGAYGEAKAALDALVTRWHAEPVWAENTSLVHALIGWVRGTGLMGGNDPLVEAVEAAGVTTYSTEEMAKLLVSNITHAARAEAASGPVVVDYTGGLGEADLDLAELGRNVEIPADQQNQEEERRTVKALPTPYRRPQQTKPDFNGKVIQDLADMVVIVGAGELGPYGSARTRFDAEISGDLSAAGVTELAWNMGLIHWDIDPTPGWYDTAGEAIDEADIYDRFHDEVWARVGIRRYHDDFHMVNNFAPELTTIYLDHDLSFSVADKETARTFVDSEPENTSAWFDEEAGEWIVTRRAGSAIRVPRRMAMSRFVGGQVPEGFDPTVYGIPADMADSLDRVALWNIICTVDAFLSSGFSPAELMRVVHPTRVSSSQGTGMGGMESLRSLYVDGLLAEPRASDILQEALPNVTAAHVMQSYIGGYGQMVHPVAACATTAVSVEEGMDKIRLGKADFVVAGGFDDLSIEGITGFGDMSATANSGELEGKGIEHRYFSRANDRRRAGFIESAGGGTILLARATLAADMGLPVLGVIGFAESFADGAHTSIPAPGLGALSAAQGGPESRLAHALSDLGVSVDEIAVISKHDTSTEANDPNESELHERMARALGRTAGNPLFVISQKSLTGHSKGGAAAFQIIGLTQVLRGGVLPPNRSLDCVDPVLAEHEYLVWLREPLSMVPRGRLARLRAAKAGSKRVHLPKAGLVTSLGFGHVSAMVAVVHPGAFIEALRVARSDEDVTSWIEVSTAREEAGFQRILMAMYGGAPLYERPVDRNLGDTGTETKEREAAILLDSNARLVDGVLRPATELDGSDSRGAEETKES